MGQNKEQLNKLLDFINELAQVKDNLWFVNELGKRYGSSFNVRSVVKDVKTIREALHIKGNPSLNYIYVNNDTLRDQLLIDNLRMENYALDLRMANETERFYYFCINAFYQIENLLNYYYHTVYQSINDLLTHIEDHTMT